MHTVLMMLREWIDKAKLTPTAFARRIGVSHATVSRWLDGKTLPSPRAIRAVFVFTDGAVTASDLLNEDAIRTSDDALLRPDIFRSPATSPDQSHGKAA